MPGEGCGIVAQRGEGQLGRPLACGVLNNDIINIDGIGTSAIDTESHIEYVIGCKGGGVYIKGVLCPCVAVATIAGSLTEGGGVGGVSHEAHVDARVTAGGYLGPEVNLKVCGVGTLRHGRRNEVLVIVGIEVHALLAAVGRGGAYIVVVAATGTCLDELPAEGVGTCTGGHILEALAEWQLVQRGAVGEQAYNVAPKGVAGGAKSSNLEVVSGARVETTDGAGSVGRLGMVNPSGGGVCLVPHSPATFVEAAGPAHVDTVYTDIFDHQIRGQAGECAVAIEDDVGTIGGCRQRRRIGRIGVGSVVLIIEGGIGGYMRRPSIARAVVRTCVVVNHNYKVCVVAGWHIDGVEHDGVVANVRGHLHTLCHQGELVVGDGCCGGKGCLVGLANVYIDSVYFGAILLRTETDTCDTVA